MVNLGGDQGETQSNESVEAVRDIVAQSHPPVGVKAYVTGQAPLTADNTEAGERAWSRSPSSRWWRSSSCCCVVYRSIIDRAADDVRGRGRDVCCPRRGRRSSATFGVLGLSTFATELLTSLAIAAGTDYAIFLVGRYQEARQAGEEREDAYYTAFHGVGHVILGSGLTVAGAMLCLHFTRLNYFKSMGIPSAIALRWSSSRLPDAGARSARCRQPVRTVRCQAKDQDPRLETRRRRRRPLARHRFWQPPPPSRSSACWPFLDTRPAITTATTSLPICPRMSVTRPPSAISAQPG